MKNEYFDNIQQELKNYGTIESIYSSNLEKGIIQFKNLRRLEISDGEIVNQKFVDQKLDKTFSLIKESSKLVKQFIENTDIFTNVIEVQDTHIYLSPIVTIVPLQLLAYYISKEKGLDVDKPRNLAKSVTVE